MRVTIKVDSATAEEVFDLTAAFQRTTRSREYPEKYYETERNRFDEQLRENPAWQQHVAEQSGRHPLPPGQTERPLVSIAGVAFGWQSPALREAHAALLLIEYERLQAERTRQTVTA